MSEADNLGLIKNVNQLSNLNNFFFSLFNWSFLSSYYWDELIKKYGIICALAIGFIQYKLKNEYLLPIISNNMAPILVFCMFADFITLIGDDEGVTFSGSAISSVFREKGISFLFKMIGWIFITPASSMMIINPMIFLLSVLGSYLLLELKAGGVYNILYNHFYDIYLDDEKLILNSDNTFSTKNNNKKIYLSLSEIIKAQRNAKSGEKSKKLRFMNKEIVGGGDMKETEDRLLIAFTKAMYKYFVKYPSNFIYYYIYLTGSNFIIKTKDTITYIIPDYIKSYFTNKKPDLKQLTNDNIISVINKEDNDKLLKIIKKYNFEVQNKEENIDLEKLYKKMLKVKDNNDFIIVHKIYLKTKLGQLKNKDDWRVISLYKKILYSRKL